MERPRIRHIALNVQDRDKEAEYYKKVFGMEEKERGPNGTIYLSDGFVGVALISRSEMPWGINHFGFQVEDIGLGADDNLSLDEDPKLVWARRHPQQFPVEINTASRSALLRVPGIGPILADRIIRWRRRGRFRDVGDLRKAGAIADRVAPFITLDGRPPPAQLTLWDQ